MNKTIERANNILKLIDYYRENLAEDPFGSEFDRVVYAAIENIPITVPISDLGDVRVGFITVK